MQVVNEQRDFFKEYGSIERRKVQVRNGRQTVEDVTKDYGCRKLAGDRLLQ